MSRPITTIITPAAGTDLVSLARLKSELGITDDDSDAILAPWITEESGTVTDYLGRVLAQEKVSDEFRLRGTMERLILTRRPVVSVDTIVDGGITLGAGDYERDDGPGLLYRLSGDCRIPWCGRAVVVTYTAGYVLPDSAPGWATKAVITCLMHRWAAKDRDPALMELNIPGVVDEKYKVGSLNGGDALPPGVGDQLFPHINASS